MDFRLAWRRVKYDSKTHNFLRSPDILDAFEHHLNDRLTTLEEKVLDGSFIPSSMRICEVPKKGGTVRTGNYLPIEDRLVYAASVGECQAHIYDALKWAQDEIDFSYRLTNDHSLKKWFKNIYSGWKNFRESSLDKLCDFNFVVFTDISNFYDALHIRTLTSSLSDLGIRREVVDLISDCLQTWDVFEGRGIPQGMSASHILAKFYLNNVDHNLKRMGYTHCRYSDDYRIFCKSISHAKKALIDITRLMRSRGLKMQSAKTKIMSASKAKQEIEGVQPIIRNVDNRLAEEANVRIPVNPYVQQTEPQREGTNEPNLEVLRKAYRRYLISEDSSFDKSLFHYLIKRLGRKEDKIAVSHCLSLLVTHPQETTYILEYFSEVDEIEELEPDLTRFMKSDESVYEYQMYQIILHLTDSISEPSDQLMNFVYSISFDSARPVYLRGACIRCLGEHGSPADLERVRSEYVRLPLQNQYEAICALRNAEKSKRNSFYNAVSRESRIHKLHTSFVKAT